MDYTGTSGNDNLRGTSGDDAFQLSQGGNDTVSGRGGDDQFIFGDAFTARDTVNGGSGNDLLALDGDYTGSHALVFGTKTMTNVELIQLEKGHSYTLATSDATVARKQLLNIDGADLQKGDSLNFDGSRETNGYFFITGGAGNDKLVGGALSDSFNLTYGGNDVANGGLGNDIFYGGAAFTEADQIDGGGGRDTLELDGAYTGRHALTLDANTVVNVEKIVLEGGLGSGNYSLTLDDVSTPAGKTLTIDASGLTDHHKLIFDGSEQTTGNLKLIGSSTGDKFVLPSNYSGDLSINGGGGKDALSINGGASLTLPSLVNVENLLLGAGGNYSLTFDHIATAGAPLTVHAEALGAGNSIAIDDESDAGNLRVFGGAGDDTVSFANWAGDVVHGGAGNNTVIFDGDVSGGYVAGFVDVQTIKLTAGHDYDFQTDVKSPLTIDASALNPADRLTYTDFPTASSVNLLMGAALTASDQIDGRFHVTVVLDGDYTLTFGADTIENVNALTLEGAHDYNLTMNENTVGTGETLHVDASGVTGGHGLIFDGSQIDGSLDITGSAGNDTLTGGDSADTFTGGAGADTFKYTAVEQSSAFQFDTITDFAAGTDHFSMGFVPSEIDAVSGSISNFDSDMPTVVGTVANHAAVVVTATGGTYSGDVFLVVDANGDGHYSETGDYVINITGYTGTITTGDFS